MDFKLLNDVSHEKKNVVRDSPERLKDWNPFLANLMLSQHKDAILIVNEANCRPSMTPKMHYYYLFYMLPKNKRFAKLKKPKKQDDIELLKAYFNYSQPKAEEILDLFDDEQLDRIRQKMQTGGFDKKRRKK